MGLDSLKMIEENWLAICIESNQSEESCKLAFSKNKNAFKYFLDKYKNEQMSLEAVKHNSSFLEFIPQSLQTPEIIKIALKDNDYNFTSVQNQTEEMCFEMVKKNSDHFSTCLFKSDRIIKLALTKDFTNIVYIDKVIRENVDIVLKKVTSSKISQEVVDKIMPFLNRNDILRLIKQAHETIKFIDQDVDLCLEFLKYHPNFYNYIKIVSDFTSSEDCISKLKAKKKLSELVSS